MESSIRYNPISRCYETVYIEESQEETLQNAPTVLQEEQEKPPLKRRGRPPK